jgi:DNA-binding winged helix-turn-helix (wHTH) protein/predicted esterase
MILRFEDCELDTGRYEMRRGGQPLHVEPQVFDLLCLLVEHRDRIVSKDELFEKIWDGRIVSDETLGSRINAARKAIGDNGTDQRLIRTTPRRGFRFIGEVEEPGGAGGRGGASAPTPKQDIRFCKSPGGVRLAYATAGEGPPLVQTANWLTHLEYDWESPILQRTLERMATGRRLVRYDERGCGLSDWEVEDISFDAFLRDLETITDAIGLQRFDLLGRSQGCAVAIAYAVRHPERVSRLVLLNGYAQGRECSGDPAEVEKAAALRTLIRQGWGDEHSALLPAFTAMYAPDSTAEQIRGMAELQRRSANAENAMRIRDACDKIDIVDLLPQVKAPTLVLHVRHDSVAPFEQGHFVPLESNNHVLHPEESAWERCYSEIEAFLAPS